MGGGEMLGVGGYLDLTFLALAYYNNICHGRVRLRMRIVMKAPSFFPVIQTSQDLFLEMKHKWKGQFHKRWEEIGVCTNKRWMTKQIWSLFVV